LRVGVRLDDLEAGYRREALALLDQRSGKRLHRRRARARIVEIEDDAQRPGHGSRQPLDRLHSLIADKDLEVGSDFLLAGRGTDRDLERGLGRRRLGGTHHDQRARGAYDRDEEDRHRTGGPGATSHRRHSLANLHHAGVNSTER
jgi:hypothetical protein